MLLGPKGHRGAGTQRDSLNFTHNGRDIKYIQTYARPTNTAHHKAQLIALTGVVLLPP